MHNYFKKRIFVTASLGNTHDDNIRMAKKLIVISHRAKVDAVKFKKKKDGLFGKEEFDQINEMCNQFGILWYVSIYDKESLEFMEKNYNPAMYKIPSCKLTDVNLVIEIARKRKTTFMSTGMATIKEVDQAVTSFLHYNNSLVIMHCSSIYPAEAGDVNLRVMRTFHKHWNLHTGYDSHDLGNSISLAAVGMGAKAIEKHVTLNRALPGEHHSMAMEPEALEKLVKEIRNIEKSFGYAHKRLLDREIPFRVKFTGEDEKELYSLERG